MNPFDFVKSINETKVNLLNEEGVLEKDYNPFLVNKAFSYYQDTIFLANEMNRFLNVLPNRLQYEFYLYVIPKRKRYSKWFKKENEINTQELLDLIQKEYGYSRRKAEEVFSLFSEQEYNNLKQKYYEGGQ